MCPPYVHHLLHPALSAFSQPHSWTWDEDTFSELAHFKRDKRKEQEGIGDQLVAGGLRRGASPLHRPSGVLSAGVGRTCFLPALINPDCLGPRLEGSTLYTC